MRMGFGLIGLLVVLAIVALLVKKQMDAMRVALPPAMQSPAPGAASATVRDQSRQIEQQVQQQLDAIRQQQQRAMPEDAQ